MACRPRHRGRLDSTPPTPESSCGGDDVAATGLFSEHFQKENLIWSGERGSTIFFQNEFPYDPPNQAAWQHDGILGYAAYKVADSVKKHEVWGGGAYIYTNVNPTLHATHGFEVPVTPGVRLHDLVTVSLNNAGTIDHIVNDAGDPVVPGPNGSTVSYLAEYPVAVGARHLAVVRGVRRVLRARPGPAARRVLDCSAGTSGFVAGARERGCAAVAVDPAYREPLSGCGGRAEPARGGPLRWCRHRDRFSFDWYGTPERQRELRAAALDAFLADRRRIRAGTSRRRSHGCRSPHGSFDLALCSHLLFTWADVFDEAWHAAAIREMARVAREVRVFPLLHQGAGEPVAFLTSLREARGRGASGPES